METRQVLAWHFTPSDLLELARLCIAGAVLVVLNSACDRIEAWVDRRVT